MSIISKTIAQGAPLIVAQASSSLGNLLLTILIARETDINTFAIFAMVPPVWMVMQRLIRVYFLIPRQISAHRYSNPGPVFDPPLAGPLAVSILVAIIASLVGIGLGGAPLVWIGAFVSFFPGLTLYDALRNEYIVLHKTTRVAAIDTLWLVGQIGGSAAVIALSLSPVWHIVAWGIPPTLIALHGCAKPSLLGQLRIREAKDQIKTRRSLTADAATDVMNSVLVVQGVPYIVAILAGLSIAGQLRGALTLFGPINVAILSLTPLLQMATARRDGSGRMGWVLGFCGLTVVLALLFGTALALLPHSFGTMLLGDTWYGAALMVIPVAIQAAIRAPLLAATTTLRSLGQHRLLIQQRVASSVLLVVGAGLGSLASSPTGAAWGFAIATGIASIISIIALRRGMAMEAQSASI